MVRLDTPLQPGDGPYFQRGPGEDSRTGEAGALAGGYDVIQVAGRDIRQLGTNDGVVRGGINDQNGQLPVDFDLDQDQPEQATVFEGNFLWIRGLRKGWDLEGGDQHDGDRAL